MLQYRRVPTLVPKSLLPTVTQEHLPGRKSDALRALESCQVTVDREIYSLKIRVSRTENYSLSVQIRVPPCSVRLIRIGLGRSSPLRGALRAS
jgi:hypothetical protein